MAADFDIARSVTRNTVVLMGSQVVTWASSFVLMLFLPRYLGSVEYGRLYLAMSVSGIFQIFIDFGGRYSIAKDVSRFRESAPQLVVNALGVRVVLWAASLIGIVLFGAAARYPADVQVLFLIFGISMLWEGARKVLWSCYQGFEQMRYPSLGAITERLFVTAVGVTALLLGAKSITLGVIIAVSVLLNCLVCVHFAPRILSRLPAFDWTGAKALLKEGLPYFLWSVFGVIYYRIDTVMLSFFSPEAVVGWYGAAYRFFDILMFLPSIFSIAVFPVMSRLWKDEGTNMEATTRKSTEFILMAGIPISIAIFAFSGQIISLFFGLEQYGESVGVLQIFAVGLLLVYIDMVIGTAILASDKQKQLSIVAFVAIFINVGLNLLLIPYTQARLLNGGVGAAIATIVTEFFIMVTTLNMLPKGAFAGSSVRVPVKALVGGGLMAGVLWAMHGSGLSWFAQAAAGGCVYASALLLFRILEPAEMAFVRSLLTLRNLKRTFLPEEGANL